MSTFPQSIYPGVDLIDGGVRQIEVGDPQLHEIRERDAIAPQRQTRQQINNSHRNLLILQDSLFDHLCNRLQVYLNMRADLILISLLKNK